MILAQFPDIPQFRPAGWFCVAVGVALLLLQIFLFQGECTWQNRKTGCTSKPKPSLLFVKRRKDLKCTDAFCQALVSLFMNVHNCFVTICNFPEAE